MIAVPEHGRKVSGQHRAVEVSLAFPAVGVIPACSNVSAHVTGFSGYDDGFRTNESRSFKRWRGRMVTFALVTCRLEYHLVGLLAPSLPIHVPLGSTPSIRLTPVPGPFVPRHAWAGALILVGRTSYLP